MSKVYRVASFYEERYFNTVREANRYKPGGEEPEAVECLDAAAECNELLEQLEEEEKRFNQARLLLQNVSDAYACERTGIMHGKEIDKFLVKYPRPPATAADRDGQRSYGV